MVSSGVLWYVCVNISMLILHSVLAAAKLMARRNRLKRVSLPVKRVIHDRKARSKSKIESIPKSPVINRVLRTRSSDDPKPGAQSAAQEHSKFVRDVAKQFYWSEQTAHAICTGIKNAMHLYHDSKLQEFYKQITANSPGKPSLIGIFVARAIFDDVVESVGLKLSAALLDVQNILKSFEKRTCCSFWSFLNAELSWYMGVQDLAHWISLKKLRWVWAHAWTSI